MKTFNEPYLKVINLGQKEELSTGCALECRCNVDTCTCNTVCTCVGDCTINIVPSN